MAELSNELKAKLKQAQSLEEVTGLLQAAGQDTDQAEKMWRELEKERALEDKELSLDELKAVSGGYLWFGEDAPDGHELNCFLTYYDGWSDFDSYDANQRKYCIGSKGKKHEWADEQIDLGPVFGFSTITICKRCGRVKNADGSVTPF